MTTTDDICHVIQTLWNENGLATENVSEPLQAYWARIENCPPMNPKQSGDINQKHWDWYCGNIMTAIPPELMHFLKEHRGRTADPAGPWRAGLNAVLDRQAPPLARYVRAQALIPLLAPVIKVEHLPFFRFEKAPGAGQTTPKHIGDEIMAALQDQDRAEELNAFKHAYHEENSALTSAELHYGSLLLLPLLACVHAGLIDPRDTLRQLITNTDSPLRISNFYPGSASLEFIGGVPDQVARFLIPDHRDLFLELPPPLVTLDTGLFLYRTGSFMALTGQDDKLFKGFMDSLPQSFFVREGEYMHISNRVPPARWLDYAKAARAWNIVLAPWVNDTNREAFGPDLVAWYRGLLTEDLKPKERWTVFRFLAPFEAGETVLGFIHYMEETHRKALGSDFTSSLVEYIVKEIKDPVILSRIILNENYRPCARKQAMNNYEYQARDRDWKEFYPLAQSRPEMFLDHNVFPYNLPNHDAGLIEHIWQASHGHGKEDELHNLVLISILSCNYRWKPEPGGDPATPLNRLAHQVFDHLPDQATNHLLSLTNASHLLIAWWRNLGHPLIDRLLLRICAASSDYKERLKETTRWSDSDKWFDMIRSLVDACPEDLLSLTPAQLRDVLTVIDPHRNLVRLSPFIQNQAITQNSPELHLFLADWLAPLPMDQLDELGWLDPKFKRFETVSVEILLRKEEPSACRMLEAFYPKVKKRTIKDRILDKLEDAGLPVQALDELDALDQAGLEQAAGKHLSKKMSASIKKIWREDLPERFAPLTPALLQWLFLLCEQTCADKVPRTARKILALIDREHQALLTLYLFERWFANKGNIAQEWAVLLLDGYGDDRLVPLLTDAVKHWNKKSKTKTNKVIGWLGRLGTTYALSQIRQIFEGHYSEAIIRHSRAVLTQVSDERGMTLEELFEELTPTLDYTNKGLLLDVGSRVYAARFDAKGALVVIDEKGKKTKSLPTCKKEDDPLLHKAAKNKLAFFKKNIKSLIKQQTMNFARALHQGKQWPAARWRILFLDHPLLAAMGQSLIWDGGGINGDRAGFRLSEDFSLLTVDDDTLDFDQLETVRLWHPMEWEEQAVTAWANHLKDYKLTPIIDQVSAPVHHLEGEELPARELVRFQGYVTNQGSFRHILKKNGFAQDATEDGGRFYGHHLVAGARRLHVHLHHTPMTAWMEVEEEAAIEKVTFYDTETKTDLSLDQVNPRLIAWIIDVLEQIAQKGEGYQDDWRSLS